MAIRILTAVMAILLCAGCADRVGERSETALAFRCEAPSGSDRWALESQARALAVTTADHAFQSGAVRLIDLVSGSVAATEGKASPDAVVREGGGDAIYVLDRYGYDVIRRIFLPSMAIDAEIRDREQGVASTNLIDAVPIGDSLFVTRNNGKTLREYDRGTLELRDAYDLSAFADDDGIPEASWMARDGDRLLVQLQRLDQKDLFTAKVPGRIALFDLGAKRVEPDAIELERANPVTEFRAGPDGAWYVGTKGKLGVTDGAIEAISAADRTARAVLSEESLGGDIIDFAWLDSDRLVVILEPQGGGTRVLDVILSGSGAPVVLSVLESDAPYYRSYSGVRYIANCGRIFLLDRDLERSGILPLRVGEGLVPIESERIDLRLPPYHAVPLR